MSFLTSMHSISLLLFLYFLIPFCSSQPNFLRHWCNNAIGNHTKTSQFATNLNTLLNTLINQTTSPSNPHFTTLATGSTTDKVNVMAQCWADVDSSDCKSCFSGAAREIRAVCPNQKEAMGWLPHCNLRYSNRQIFKTLDTNPTLAYMSSDGVSSDPSLFYRQLFALLQQLQVKAAAGDSRRKYAYGMSLKTDDVINIYAKVECTPDLVNEECSMCIQQAMEYVNMHWSGDNSGLEWVVPSCYARYDINQVYNTIGDELPIIISSNSNSPPTNNGTLTPTSPGTPTVSVAGKSKKSDKPSIIVMPIVGAISIIMLIGILWKRKQRQSTSNFNGTRDNDINSTFDSLQVKYGVLKLATKDFSDDNKLGQGGFGIVYKGRFPNGQEVAVKRLLKKSMSAHYDQQFKNEIMILAKLRHRNLVKLLGFCLEEEEKILIYELVSNSSLDNFIFDPVQRAYMLWDTRYKIINGIARGLLYLHEETRVRIIHHDLKPSNILLDAEFNPKIADFGMARLFNIDHTETMASKIVGTYGYMSPEYALRGQVSVKLDVFSFGVLVLEIVSGKRISSFFEDEEITEGLLTYAWKNWQQGTPWKIVDPTLSSSLSPDILECIHIGLLCVQHNQANRPTMSSVALMLSSSSHTLPTPLPPGFCSQGNKKLKKPLLDHVLDHSSCTLTAFSENETSVTELYPR